MCPVILSIYGPIKINSFSLLILISILVFIYLIQKDQNIKRLFGKEDILNLVSETALIAIIGGRFLHVINNYKNYSNILDIISIWNGGLAVIGALISGIIYLFFVLSNRKLDVIYIFDIVASYLPIVHAISRIGCFLAGCCYGIPADIFWAINFRHPTQIYSSLNFCIIFILMQFLYRKYYVNKLMPGILFSAYLIFISLERFFVDFLRDDREYYALFNYFSKAQIQASMIFVITSIAFLAFYVKQKNKSKYLL